MNLVGLIGPARCGKSTVASMLVRYGYNEYFFSKPLKEACRHLFLLSQDQLYGDSKDIVDKRWEVTPRYLMQKLGTDLLRDTLPIAAPVIKLSEESLHLSILAMRLNASPSEHTVISDVRFRDEVNFIKKRGGILIRIIRPTDISTDQLHASTIKHQSESELNDYNADEILLNNTTKDALEAQVDKLVNKLSQIRKYSHTL